MIKKNKSKITLIIMMLILLNNIALSKNYICPRLPYKFYIGQITNSNWYIWPEDTSYNFVNRFYYKLFKKEKLVKYWGGFPTGWINKGDKSETNYIGCCILYKKNKIKLCAYKNVKEDNCKADIRGPGPDGFICPDNDDK